eukprot:3473528-Pyramimonas_sp.AAC.1
MAFETPSYMGLGACPMERAGLFRDPLMCLARLNPRRCRAWRPLRHLRFPTAESNPRSPVLSLSWRGDVSGLAVHDHLRSDPA